ncbi:hypothetical protein HYH02_010491 [Chlamydomonas schloesseri]|uniref:Thioesterase domain-containing protein n=1 Tax=Chlamydomonas schloesseri TaxID=2026947 RepID=A0A835W7B8_9CHLO|nr:hypothetical protein HYH02_010491 [Chlamydomonas schloesseri]|eukprot:KAG2439859.1 hypothetical protein HYH02_010491 [Chlamydomonas schloesseri]
MQRQEAAEDDSTAAGPAVAGTVAGTEAAGTPPTASDNSAGLAAAAGSASGPGAGPSGSGAGAYSATRPRVAAAEDDSAAAGAEAAGTLRRVRDPPTQGTGPLAAGADPERTGRGRTPAAGLGAGAADGSPRCGCREVCGFPQTVHGGLTAAVVDETLGGLAVALWRAGQLGFRPPAYTARLDVDYMRVRRGRALVSA